MEKRIVKFAGCFCIMQSISAIAGGVCSSGNTVQTVGADYYDRDDEKDNGAQVPAVQDPDVEAAIISVSARRARNISDGSRKKIEMMVANAPVVKLRMLRTAETKKLPKEVNHEKLDYLRDLSAEVDNRKSSRSASVRGDEKKSSHEEDKKNDQNSLNTPPESPNLGVADLD